jgi:hypothetical protein
MVSVREQGYHPPRGPAAAPAPEEIKYKVIDNGRVNPGWLAPRRMAKQPGYSLVPIWNPGVLSQIYAHRAATGCPIKYTIMPEWLRCYLAAVPLELEIYQPMLVQAHFALRISGST